MGATNEERASERPDLNVWRPDWDFGPLDEHSVYTRANIGEVVPGVLSPLNASLGGYVLDAAFIMLARMLGMWEPFLDEVPPEVARGERAAYVGIFYGHAYLNLTLLTRGASLIPGTSPEALEEQYLGRARQPGAPRPRLTLKERRVGLLALPHILRLTLRARRLADQQEEFLARFLARFNALDLHTLDDAALLAWVDRVRNVAEVVMALHLFNSSGASSGLEQLTQAVRRWLPDASPGLTERLVTGLADIESAQPAYELWRLSRIVAASPALSRLFAAHEPAELHAALAAATDAEAERFRREMAAFLGRYGYRAMRETELSVRPWSQEPSFVYATIKSYLTLGDEADPTAARDRQAAIRAEAEREALARLRPLERAVFARQLTLARTFIALREKTKAQYVRAIGPARLICQEMGRRLQERGLLPTADDIFLLLAAELRDALAGQIPAARLAEIVADRRRQVAWCEQVVLPEWFEGTPQARWADEVDAPGTDAAAAADGEEEVLHGIPVSPGRVRGRARVICELTDDATVEPGEILVAPYTDAAWTPLFFTAAGVVVDLGGPLSHGSTVAREYGLPAVVNVKVGTQRIRTGQEITVDGAAGEVILHG
jgi:phosphohistidine swiveling domain-containing protein